MPVRLEALGYWFKAYDKRADLALAAARAAWVRARVAMVLVVVVARSAEKTVGRGCYMYNVLGTPAIKSASFSKSNCRLTIVRLSQG